MPLRTRKRVEPPPSVKPSRGRPRVHRESWVKVSVVLFERQVLRLDRLTTEMRRKSGKAMTRAQVIRALIDGLLNSGLDVSAQTSEAMLRAHLAARLKPSRPTP